MASSTQQPAEFDVGLRLQPELGGHQTAEPANFDVCEDFDQSLDGIHLLSSLRSLTLGCDFNQSLEGIKLPKQLANFDVCEDFNQGLDGIHLLSSLRSLTLGFNQSLEGIKLPSSLQTLTFVRISTRVWMASIYRAACRV